jgi:hypothetical protein
LRRVFVLNANRGFFYSSTKRISPMPEKIPADKPATATPNVDSAWARLLPAAIAAAWYWSEIKLVPECHGLQDWRILGIALPVFWLGGIGPHAIVRHHVWKVIGGAIALLVIGLLAGGLIPDCKPDTSLPYCSKVLYALMHAFIVSSFGIFAFLALRSPDKQT